MTNFAKKVLTRSLEHLSVGLVTIQQDGNSQVFGNTGDLSVTVNINNDQAYSKIMFNGFLGAAQAYIDGDWETDNLTNLIRIMIRNEQAMTQLDTILNKLTRRIIDFKAKIKPNTINQSKKQIYLHYDLGNDFFKTFLDDSLMYSCAIFQSPDDSLATAQERKIKLIAEKLAPKKDDHILEIGSGWGSLAIFLAQQYGCKITTTTISEQQYHYVKDRIAQLNLENQITLLNKDYRQLDGQYDKIVSIEMIEAVGHHFFDIFFHKCDQLLKDGGLLMMQTIIINEQAYEQAKKHIDFIKKYVFPGGCLPSIGRIGQSIAQHTNMQWLSLDDIGHNYVYTLQHWRQRFSNKLDDVRKLGFTEEFIRMWYYYFSYCEAGFDEDYISDVQLLFRKK